MNPPALLRFNSEQECLMFLCVNDIGRALAVNRGTHHIAIVLDARGVFGITSPTTMLLLPDW